VMSFRSCQGVLAAPSSPSPGHGTPAKEA
jgi:hypothetical protein